MKGSKLSDFSLRLRGVTGTNNSESKSPGDGAGKREILSLRAKMRRAARSRSVPQQLHKKLQNNAKPSSHQSIAEVISSTKINPPRREGEMIRSKNRIHWHTYRDSDVEYRIKRTKNFRDANEDGNSGNDESSDAKTDERDEDLRQQSLKRKRSKRNEQKQQGRTVVLRVRAGIFCLIPTEFLTEMMPPCFKNEKDESVLQFQTLVHQKNQDRTKVSHSFS